MTPSSTQNSDYVHKTLMFYSRYQCRYTFDFTTADEELILNIDEMLRLLDRFDVGVHDAMFGIWRS